MKQLNKNKKNKVLIPGICVTIVLLACAKQKKLSKEAILKHLLTGDEAVARGAYEAGVRFAAAYPGTPSTEILENISKYKGVIKAEWAPNEK